MLNFLFSILLFFLAAGFRPQKDCVVERKWVVLRLVKIGQKVQRDKFHPALVPSDNKFEHRDKTQCVLHRSPK
jgi:hypothetical protein